MTRLYPFTLPFTLTVILELCILHFTSTNAFPFPKHSTHVADRRLPITFQSTRAVTSSLISRQIFTDPCDQNGYSPCPAGYRCISTSIATPAFICAVADDVTSTVSCKNKCPSNSLALPVLCPSMSLQFTSNNACLRGSGLSCSWKRVDCPALDCGQPNACPGTKPVPKACSNGRVPTNVRCEWDRAINICYWRIVDRCPTNTSIIFVAGISTPNTSQAAQTNDNQEFESLYPSTSVPTSTASELFTEFNTLVGSTVGSDHDSTSSTSVPFNTVPTANPSMSQTEGSSIVLTSTPVATVSNPIISSSPETTTLTQEVSHVQSISSDSTTLTIATVSTPTLQGTSSLSKELDLTQTIQQSITTPVVDSTNLPNQIETIDTSTSESTTTSDIQAISFITTSTDTSITSTLDSAESTETNTVEVTVTESDPLPSTEFDPSNDLDLAPTTTLSSTATSESTETNTVEGPISESNPQPPIEVDSSTTTTLVNLNGVVDISSLDLSETTDVQQNLITTATTDISSTILEPTSTSITSEQHSGVNDLPNATPDFST